MWVVVRAPLTGGMTGVLDHDSRVVQLYIVLLKDHQSRPVCPTAEASELLFKSLRTAYILPKSSHAGSY